MPDSPDVPTGASVDAKIDSDTDDVGAVTREIRYWLEWQSRMISGVIGGGVFLRAHANSIGAATEITWPKSSADTALLHKLAQETMAAEKPLIRGNVSDGSTMLDIIACPIRRDKQLAGAVVFTLTNRTESQRESVLQLMQWCAVWLENLMDTPVGAEISDAESKLQAIKLMSAAAPLAVSGNQLCNYFVEEFDCSLVALGLYQELKVHVVALSNQMDFDRRTQRISEIELAMEECADQDASIFMSSESSGVSLISQAHSQLMKKNADSAVYSVPVRVDSEIIGVLTFVKPQKRRFSAVQRHKIGGIAAAIGPALNLQTIVSQPLVQRLRHSVAGFYKRLLGRENIKLKTVVGLFVLIPLLLMTVPAQQRITSTASLEGSMHQAIVAPIAGYIKSVHARAGDTVTAGQALVALDDQSLALQIEKWRGERDKLSSEYQLAWANRDKAQVSILAARLAQSEAQLALVENERAHSEILAPFDGLLINGDLSRLTGTPVEQGQLLYELVPLTGFKVILSISEYDVGKLEDGQQGVLRLTGSPDRPIDFVIQKAFPVSSVKQGKNVFSVEALLQNPPENLRPGMQGIGKITIGDSTIGSVWTQSLRERLKMRAWYFGF